MICPSCGEFTSPRYRRCPHCGTLLPATSEEHELTVVDYELCARVRMRVTHTYAPLREEAV